MPTTLSPRIGGRPRALIVGVGVPKPGENGTRLVRVNESDIGPGGHPIVVWEYVMRRTEKAWTLVSRRAIFNIN